MGLLIWFHLLFLTTATFVYAATEEAKVSVCISCHREMDGEMAEPVDLWEKSIHRQMGNSCDGCHGGNPNDPAEAMNPAKGFLGTPRQGEVPEFCGKCHVGVVENYKKSPHYAAFLQGSGPNCVTCHGSHDVRRASFDLISEELCSTCHSYDNGRNMKQAFVSAELKLQGMREELRRLDRRGMPVKKLEEKLFAERNALHQMTHTLDMGEVQNKTKAVLTDLEGMERETEILNRKVHRRWWIGGGVGLFFAVLIILLIRLHRQLEED